MLIERIKPKYIIIVIISLFALTVVGVFNYTNTTSNPLLIRKIPTDAKLFIDGQAVDGGRTSLSNGLHQIKAEKEGFITLNIQMLVDENTKYIPIALAPNSDAAKKWVAENQRLYLDQEQLVGVDSESVTSNSEKDPFISSLPITTSNYSIGYKLDPSDPTGKSVIVTVKSVPGYNNAAIRAMYKAGHNPALYPVSFDFTSWSPDSEGGRG